MIPDIDDGLNLIHASNKYAYQYLVTILPVSTFTYMV